jgi:Cation transport ATPase
VVAGVPVPSLRTCWYIILIAAAAVSLLTGDPESAMVIYAVLLLNAVLGPVQHQKAEKSQDSLKQLTSPEARFIRAGALEINPTPWMYR